MDEALCRISWSDEDEAAAAADDDDDVAPNDDVDEEDDGVRKDMDEALGLTGSLGGGGGGPGWWWWVGDPIPLSINKLSTASALDDMAASDCCCRQGLLATNVLVM